MLRRYSMLLVIVILLVTWGNTTAHAAFDATLAQQLQDALETQQTSLNLTGVSAAVIVPGQGTWLGASGESNPETGDPVTPDMLFWIASISKTFTSALILQLAEEEKLTLEDPLHAWLPSYPNIDSTITIRQLLNHTSGIYDHMASPSIEPSFLADPARYWKPEEVLAAFVHDPYFEAGTSWKYSNTNYLLLGMIAEKATQSDLPTEMQNRFGDPLQLDNTHFMWSEALPDNFIHPWYDLDGDGTSDDLLDFYGTASWSIVWAAGGFISTVEDVATWAKHLYEADVLSQASLDQMLTFRSAALGFPATGYGLGVVRYSLFGKELWGHSGGLTGYSSLVMYVPEDGISVAVCINEQAADRLSIAVGLLKPLLDPESEVPEPGIGEMWTDIGSSPAMQYTETILTTTDHIEENLPQIVEAAEQAADRLVAGGRIYVTGDEYGFPGEAYYRGGGLMKLDHAPNDPSEMSDQDILLVGTLNLHPDPQRAQLQAMREAGALVILFGSDQSPLKDEADFLIGTGLSPGTAPAVTVQGHTEPICPAGPVANVAALWVFTGEMVAACTRRGEMPTFYQNTAESGGLDRNNRYTDDAFHDDMEIDPVPPEQLGRAYLAEIRHYLQGLRDHQMPAIRRGAWRMAEVIESGNKVWVKIIGFVSPYLFGLPGNPEVLESSTVTMSPVNVRTRVGPEDGLIYIGFYNYPEFFQGDVLRDLGVPLVVTSGGREAVPVTPLPGEIHIDPYWEKGDACVQVPGYDIKILPPSGVVQATVLSMLIGEIAAGPVIGSATMAPEIARIEHPTRLEVTVELDTPPESVESIRHIRLDLSPLGISSDLSLEDVGGRRYTGSTTITPLKIGRHVLPIEVVMETAELDEYAYLGVALNVYPVEDITIYEDDLSPGWSVEVSRAESDPTSTAFARSGISSHAILLGSGIFPGRLEYVLGAPNGMNLFGYSHLEFYINGGETVGQDPQVAGKKLSEWGIAVESDTWTRVSIPISELPLAGGRLTGVTISGTIKETFYIDDMKLVAEEPPQGEPLAVEESGEDALPASYSLSQNYPNPFNPETTIRYHLPSAGPVRLLLYNLTGQVVHTLVDGEHPAGTHSIVWDGTDDAGRVAASGVYLCRMETESYRAVRKLVLIR